MGLRLKNLSLRRERVLTAARQLIAAGGVEALSMRKLARRSGLAVNTVYNLFGRSRDDILESLVDDGIERLDRALTGAHIDDPLRLGPELIGAAVDHIVDAESVYRPVFLAELGSTQNHRWGDRRALWMGRSALEAAMRAGLLRDDLRPELLSEQILQSFQHAARLWAVGELDAGQFHSRAMYGLWVCMLAAATDESRPALAAELKAVEREIAAGDPRLERRQHGSQS